MRTWSDMQAVHQVDYQIDKVLKIAIRASVEGSCEPDQG